MILQERQDFLTSFSPAVATATTAAQTVRLEIPQDFLLAMLRIIVPVTVASGSSPVFNAGKDLFDLVDRITLSVADGAENRNVFDVSGQGAKLFAQAITRRSIASNVTATAATGDATYTLVYDLHCVDPRLPEPLRYATALPLPRYSAKPVLTLNFATGASLLASGSATITIGSVQVVTRKLAVPSTLAQSLKVYNFDTVESSRTLAATGQNSLDIPAPGIYTDLMLRHFIANGTPGAIATGNDLRFERLGVSLRRFNEITAFADAGHNALNFTAPAGVYPINFVGDESARGLDSCLDANVGVQAGVRVQLTGNYAIAGTQKIVARRILGDVSGLMAVK